MTTSWMTVPDDAVMTLREAVFELVRHHMKCVIPKGHPLRGQHLWCHQLRRHPSKKVIGSKNLNFKLTFSQNRAANRVEVSYKNQRINTSNKKMSSFIERHSKCLRGTALFELRCSYCVIPISELEPLVFYTQI